MKTRLKWFRNTGRRESDYVGKRKLKLELLGEEPRGRQKRKFIDGEKEDEDPGDWL